MATKTYPPEIQRIEKQCEIHERFLKELVRGRYADLGSYLPGDLSFGVARRWNSWYPSYFDVEGGCYVLFPGDLDPKNFNNKGDSRVGAIVIDPGFKFIDILRANYRIEPRDISTVIVTHFHPDHMAGLLEYATIMNTSKQPCNIYLNETSYSTFKSLQNAFITVNELISGQIQEIMRYVSRDGKHARVGIEAIGVHHNEIGNQHRSLGLILETTRSESEAFDPNQSWRYRIGILGDTDGNEEYLPHYVDGFLDVDILILHLGTFSNKKLGRGGKHLYIDGVERVLGLMASELGKKKASRKITILSEFGLELADDDLLYRKLQPFIESHFWRLPLIFTGLYLQRQKESKELNSDSDQEGSQFFARATLELLERVYGSNQNTIGTNQQALTRESVDELLLALGFQVLALDNKVFRKVVSELQNKLRNLIDETSKKQFMDQVPREMYLRLLKGKFEDEIALDPLRNFYRDLVEKAIFSETPFPKESLLESCDLLIEKVFRNLEDFASTLYYMDKIAYISKYADARGVKEYLWTFGKGAGITDLSLFWTACLIGVVLLRKTLEVISLEPQRGSDNLLLKVRAFFDKDTGPRNSLLLGDIGCTFGFDPFEEPSSDNRVSGIKLRSAEGRWISPFEAECFYDKQNMRISYRIAKGAPLDGSLVQ